MGSQKRRPFDPDTELKSDLSIPTTAGAPVKQFNPTPDAWRKGWYQTNSTVRDVEVWCEYRRDKEAWIPEIYPGELALVRAEGCVTFAALLNVYVVQED